MNREKSTDACSTKKQILIVDDEEPIRHVFRKLTENAGYHCATAGDAASALKFLEKNAVDVVITDINMPGMNGIQLLKIVKQRWDTDVIVMTGFAEDYTYEEIVKAGASDFIEKSTGAQEFMVRLKRVLRERFISTEHAQMHTALQEAHLELHAAYLDTISRLVLAAEYKDEDTADHIVRISRYCELIAEKSGMASPDVNTIRYAAPMHDIGKIGIPDSILMKPGKLTPDEFEIMKSHTTIGATILSNSKAKILQVAEEIAISHHEKWNGAGYPRGLSGENIPLTGRIVGLADVFDALTTRRPYKQPYSVEVACDIITKERGQHFDPALVDIFLSNLPDIQRIKMEVGAAEDICLSAFVWSERDLINQAMTLDP
jgi:putative two-component system response regulator